MGSKSQLGDSPKSPHSHKKRKKEGHSMKKKLDIYHAVLFPVLLAYKLLEEYSWEEILCFIGMKQQEAEFLRKVALAAVEVRGRRMKEARKGVQKLLSTRDQITITQTLSLDMPRNPHEENGDAIVDTVPSLSEVSHEDRILDRQLSERVRQIIGSVDFSEKERDVVDCMFLLLESRRGYDELSCEERPKGKDGKPMKRARFETLWSRCNRKLWVNPDLRDLFEQNCR